ncbi:WcbI family polysaccharide biosynthesis putative acetyltransferase [Desulfovibrio aminophilus]|nr:WcbI family polysaccharide biosynthesis putative acetyltransferase [Desulfovibrio aminophilus]MCM0756596.1 WcbI family polysaccharide biosynthesis putative acetyltransferase [Desulfovibrio aminophilus]
MERRPCVLHANCQGEPLAALLRLCPEFAARHDIRLFTNYTREPVPDGVLASCGLFLYQYLGPQWGELSSEALLKKIPGDAAALCVPNMFFMGYWPLWHNAPGFDFRDRFLDHLLDMGLSKAEILHLHLRTDLARKYDLQALLDESLEREQRRQARTPVQYLDTVLADFRERMLFNTVNHPGPELMALAARGVLAELGLTAPAEADLLSSARLFPEFQMPIHPQVAEFLGLSFAGPDTEYRVFGKKKTFAQYVEAYVDCRLLGIDDFTAYLHLR